MEIVRSLNRSWIYDTYFSLYRAIQPGGKSGGNIRVEMSGYHLKVGADCGAPRARPPIFEKCPCIYVLDPA